MKSQVDGEALRECSGASFFIVVDDVSRRQVGNETLLFKESCQALLSADPKMTGLWEYLDRGVSLESFAALHGESKADSLDFLQPLIQAGIIEAVSAEGQALVVSHRRDLSLCGLDVAVFCEGAKCAELVDELFGHTTGPEKSNTHSVAVIDQADTIGISQNGGPIDSFPWSESGPALRSHITDIVLQELDKLLLHAAVVSQGTDAAVLFGKPGAGKSVLSLALSRAGFRLDGDDIAILENDSAVRAVPFPVTLKSAAWSLFERQLDQLNNATVFDRWDGFSMRYLPPEAPATQSPRSLRFLFDLQRDSDLQPGLHRLDTVETFRLIIENARSPDDRMLKTDFQVVSDAVEGTRAYRLVYSSPEEGVELVREAFAERGCKKVNA